MPHFRPTLLRGRKSRNLNLRTSLEKLKPVALLRDIKAAESAYSKLVYRRPSPKRSESAFMKFGSQMSATSCREFWTVAATEEALGPGAGLQW